MIVSDKHRFAFIHIPKCAGSTVRQALAAYDESFAGMTAGLKNWRQNEFVFWHEGEDQFLDYHHLTLAQLQRLYPEQWEKVDAYPAYAILRDPYSRLISALYQYLRQVEEIVVHDLGPEELQARLIPILEKVDAFFAKDPQLPFDYVHFQPQSSYVELDGKRVVEGLVSISSLDQLYHMLDDQLAPHGEALEPFHLQKTNVTKAYRWQAAQNLVQRHSGLVNALRSRLPRGFKTKIRQVLLKDSDLKQVSITESKVVREFVERHYARDVALWNEVMTSES